MPIELYDVVEILDTPATREAETAGAVGPIIGESIPTQPGEEEAWAVWLEELGQAVMVTRDQIRPTGRRVPASYFAPQGSLRVSLRGEIIDDDGAR